MDTYKTQTAEALKLLGYEELQGFMQEVLEVRKECLKNRTQGGTDVDFIAKFNKGTIHLREAVAHKNFVHDPKLVQGMPFLSSR